MVCRPRSKCSNGCPSVRVQVQVLKRLWTLKVLHRTCWELKVLQKSFIQFPFPCKRCSSFHFSDSETWPKIYSKVKKKNYLYEVGAFPTFILSKWTSLLSTPPPRPPPPPRPICQTLPPSALSDLSLLRYLCMLARPQWNDSWKVDESKYWNPLSSTKSLISRDWYKSCILQLSESGSTRFPITTSKQHYLQASLVFVNL